MRNTWLLFSQTVTVGLALLFVVSTLKPEWVRSPAPVPVAAPAPQPITAPHPVIAPPLGAPASYSAAARRASPAVVSILSRKAVDANAQAQDPWFRFFRGEGRAAPEAAAGMGSGVIVTADGFVLTNNHVIEGASDIEVRLVDGRNERAKVVGTDLETDLALLKIELADLPAISFGDAATLQVGDVVLAIGNPFNVGQTVTSGIVSALGRNQLRLSTLENFIQTDAAINPGNSGGALVDSQGNLVGINTAIFSRSGGSMGIGFAIPVDIARVVMDGLVRDGVVTRGWLGVESADLSAEFIKSFGLPVSEGVLVTGVLQDGPASRAGVRPGDVVLKVGERVVASQAQLLDAVTALKPDTDTVVAVQRGDKALLLKVTVARRPKAQAR